MPSLKPAPGAKIRLIRDFETQGGKKFRAGLRMRIDYTDRAWVCGVWVRDQRHQIRVEKKYAHLYFVVTDPPPPRKEKD